MIQLECVDLPQDQIGQRFPMATLCLWIGSSRPNDQTCLAMALIAPIGQRPILFASLATEGQRINDPMAMKERQRTKDRMPIQRVDRHSTSGRRKGKLLPTERKQVRYRFDRLAERILERGFLSQKIDDGEIFRLGFQQRGMRRQGMSTTIARKPPLIAQIGPAFQLESQ